MDDLKECREAFEGWAKDFGYKFSKFGSTLAYENTSTNHAWAAWKAAWNRRAVPQANAEQPQECSCPSGDGSLRWPCPKHPPLPVAITDKAGANGIKWYVEPNLPDGVNLYTKEPK